MKKYFIHRMGLLKKLCIKKLLNGFEELYLDKLEK
jgi:hypothetical protein